MRRRNLAHERSEREGFRPEEKPFPSVARIHVRLERHSQRQIWFRIARTRCSDELRRGVHRRGLPAEVDRVRTLRRHRPRRSQETHLQIHNAPCARQAARAPAGPRPAGAGRFHGELNQKLLSAELRSDRSEIRFDRTNRTKTHQPDGRAIRKAGRARGQSAVLVRRGRRHREDASGD